MAIIAVQMLSSLQAPAYAYALNEEFSIDGMLASALQCQVLSERSASANRCRGAVPVQVELSYRPTDRDELFSKLGFAAGNGLNDAVAYRYPIRRCQCGFWMTG